MTSAAAQSVRRIQTEKAGIATGVWVGEMFYMSGQLPTPVSPADRAKGTPAVYGNTQAQAESTFNKIQSVLKEQGLGMGDVVMMRVYMAADPAMENKLDFAGMNAAYGKFFGTPDQPNKPARSTVQVAALVAAGALIEVEVQAVRQSATAQRQAPVASVFTAEQATAGRAAYAKHCASCHMPDLSGNTEVPPLAGAAFIDTWGARTTKQLFDYSAEAMPYGAPSLSEESYTAITAYILQVNGGVAGTNALSSSTVAPIANVAAVQRVGF
jgi:enamine deaminase RidA (YjgF/YER057c/UK114 family)